MPSFGRSIVKRGAGDSQGGLSPRFSEKRALRSTEKQPRNIDEHGAVDTGLDKPRMSGRPHMGGPRGGLNGKKSAMRSRTVLPITEFKEEDFERKSPIVVESDTPSQLDKKLLKAISNHRKKRA